MTASQRRVLIVEDEAKIASLLADYLKRDGFSCECVADGDAVMARIHDAPPHIVLLDLMLPGRDGLALCREIRTLGDLPIIMITARVEEIDRLLGLELGADDYICKPFSPREVVARVKAVLRRAEARAQPAPAGPFQVDAESLRVRAADREVKLTRVEFALLTALEAAPGRIFSRDELMDRIYPDGRVVSDRTVDSHVKRLRRKLDELLPGRDLIESVYGVGYRFDPD